MVLHGRDDRETDAEVEAAGVAGFVTSVNALTLDGKALPLQPIDTGAYDVISEPGSFYDTAVGVATGPIRTALRANVVFLHPLTLGDQVIEGAVSFVGDGSSAGVQRHVQRARRLSTFTRGAAAARRS